MCFDVEYQFQLFIVGFDGFWCELGDIGDKIDGCRNMQIWCGIEDQLGFIVQFQCVCLFGWQEESYIDVVEIDYIQYLIVCCQYFVWFGNLILYVFVMWGFQFVVIDICGNVLFSGLCCFDVGLCLNDIGVCCFYSCFRS